MYIVEYVCNQYIQYNMYRVPCCYPPTDCPFTCYLQHFEAPSFHYFAAPTPVYYILHTINLYYMYCIYNIQILHIIYHLHLFALSIVYITIIIYYIIL